MSWDSELKYPRISIKYKKEWALYAHSFNIH